MDYKLILLPVVGALIGYITNYFAIKLLFKPLNPVKVLGFTFQGIIPKRRKEIAISLAETIERDLLSKEDLSKGLYGENWKEDFEEMIHDAVETRIKSDSMKKIPFINLVSDNITYHVKYLISKEIINHIDDNKELLTKKVTEKLEVKDMVLSKIDTLDLKGFEKMLTDFIARELRHIEALGALMGFLIGGFQALVFHFYF